MDKKEGNNLMLGLGLGWLFFRKKKDEGKKGGILSTIVWILLIIISFSKGWTTFGIILLLPFIIGSLIGIISSGIVSREKAVNNLAELYKEGQYTKAFDEAKKIAEKNCEAATVCGLCYLKGNGCDKDLEKAFYYFKLGKKHNTEAKAYYGEMLVYGVGCEKDIKEGVNNLISATVAGDEYACLRLGELQIRGEIIPLNVESGMQNLRIASDSGYFYADYLLGYMLYTGSQGVKQNEEQGLEKIKKAADHGVVEAQKFLETL